jgi:hypothetical protein
MPALSVAGVAAAQPPAEAPTEPILRLDTVAHTAGIWRIATDRENRYAVTASLDKTARIWSLPDGKLLNVLRVPIGDGDMGKLYAVAMTPDGGTVALGGWTSASGTQTNIYIFDRASGMMQRRLSGLPNVVNHLTYSSDGQLLVAALWGANGIRVYDASRGYQPLPGDTTYGNLSLWADFDRQRRLVTTSDDGFIRLYAAGKYDSPIAKVKGSGGKDPFAAVFSPDGTRVAVGYTDSTAVDLLSGESLAFLRAAATSGVAGPDLLMTGWSVDGRYLFAGGRGNDAKVRRWGNRGSGPSIDIGSAHDTVMGLLPLQNGGMLFATAEPEFGVIDAQGRAQILQGPGQLDFRIPLGSLKISKTGTVVEQGTKLPTQTVRFALAERRLDIDPPPEASLAAPTDIRSRWTITMSRAAWPYCPGTTVLSSEPNGWCAATIATASRCGASRRQRSPGA